MTWTLGFYRSANWPDETGVTTNGGAVNLSDPITGGMYEIFGPAVSNFAGGAAHSVYRKIFIRNEDSNTIQDARVFLDNAKYPGQVTIAMEKSASDTSSDPSTAPSGYTGAFVEADGQTGAIAKIVGGADLGTNASMGLWLHLEIPAGLAEADPFVPLDVVTIGTR